MAEDSPRQSRSEFAAEKIHRLAAQWSTYAIAVGEVGSEAILNERFLAALRNSSGNPLHESRFTALRDARLRAHKFRQTLLAAGLAGISVFLFKFLVCSLGIEDRKPRRRGNLQRH